MKLVGSYGPDLKIPYIMSILTAQEQSSSDIDTIVQAIRNYQDTGSTLQDTIDANAADIDSLQTSVGTNTSAISVLNFRVAATESDIITQGLRLDGHDTDIAALQTAVDNAATFVTGTLTDLVTTVDTHGTDITALQTSVGTLETFAATQLNELNTQFSISADATIIPILLKTNYDNISSLQVSDATQYDQLTALEATAPTAGEKAFLTALDTRASSTAANVALISDIPAGLSLDALTIHKSSPTTVTFGQPLNFAGATVTSYGAGSITISAFQTTIILPPGGIYEVFASLRSNGTNAFVDVNLRIAPPTLTTVYNGFLNSADGNTVGNTYLWTNSEDLQLFMAAGNNTTIGHYYLYIKRIG